MHNRTCRKGLIRV